MSELFEADTDICDTCVEVLRTLHNAYAKMLSGNVAVKVRHNRRWTEYQPGSARALADYIRMIERQCPGAADAGIPLFAGARRGPAFLRIG